LIMNNALILESKGKKFKLRPKVRRVDPSRGGQPHLEYLWVVDAVSKEKGITLRNETTGNIFTIGLDHIREWLSDPGGSDGFLLLKDQLTLSAGSLYIEPWGE